MSNIEQVATMYARKMMRLERALEIAKRAFQEAMGRPSFEPLAYEIARTALAEIDKVMQDKDVDAPT